MSMNEIIRQKRKELNYTQEQVAQQLGVSIPAVSKWESGATYPDVEILPALARTLKIDVNTLLCFQMELSEVETNQFIAKVSELAMSDGIDQAFALAEQKIREYPSDVKLIHTLALTLQGLLTLISVKAEDRAQYNQAIQKMYEAVGNSDISEYADKANYMLASRAIVDEMYDYAQEMIDKLPDFCTLDKQMLQANLWMKTGKEKDAESVYASKTFSAISQIQITLVQLIRIAVMNADMDNASRLVHAGQTMTQVFGMWDYNSYTYSLEKAMAERNSEETIEILDKMLGALLKPWDTEKCPIFKHKENGMQETNLGKNILIKFLDSIEEDRSFDYIKNDKRLPEIIQKYREQVSQ